MSLALACIRKQSYCFARARLLSCLNFCITLAILMGDGSHAYGQTFPCDGKIYFYRWSGSQRQLAYIDDYFTSNPVVNNVCPISTTNQNALGANPIDNYLYFLDLNNSGLYRLDASCNNTLVCPNLVYADNGCFDNLGRYWVIVNSQDLMAFDINTCDTVKGPFTISGLGAFHDITFSMKNCHFYVGDDNDMVEIDTSGNTLGTYSPGFGASVGNWGGIAMGSDGDVYGIPNDQTTGRVHRFNTSTNTSDGLIYTFPDGTLIPQNCGCDMASFPCPDLDAAINADSAFGCNLPFTVNFTNTTTGLISSFLWNFGDGSVDSTNLNPSHTYTTAGVFTVTLTVNATSQCFAIPSDSISTVISISLLTGSGTSLDTTICSGGIATISAYGGNQYIWTSTGSISCTLCQSQSVTPDSTTEYWVTIIDSNGCQAFDTAVVSVFSSAQVATGPDLSICLGDSIGLSATGGTGYLWTPDSTLDNPNIPNPTAYPSITTNYTVMITDSNGCSYLDSQTVNVVSMVIADAGPDVVICQGDSVLLQASGGSTYTWNPALGLSDSTIANPYASPSASTTFYLIAAFSSCSDQDSVIVTVLMLPSVSVMPDTIICVGDSITISAVGAVSYQWNNGENTQSIMVAPISSLTYTVTGTDSMGCQNSATAQVDVQPLPVIDLGADIVSCSGDTVTITATGGVQYIWSTGD
ncbi:MAG TPA: PKD domain-containing protein, partial [Flavobacteriales bacterium]|nr:PKD domain-containing protein [Flavobacteriales bacterium]